MNVSREARLVEYAALIRKWNPVINLISPASVAELEQRHVADSTQLADLAGEAGGPWLDIGSGGGLPGIVIAICRPGLSVTLVDSDQRKVAFLQTAIRTLSLANCRALCSRIEALPPAAARHLSARALAPLDRLVPYLDRHLQPGGTGWLMKGRSWRAELDQTGSLTDYDVTIHSSATDPQAAILQLDRKPRG